MFMLHKMLHVSFSLARYFKILAAYSETHFPTRLGSAPHAEVAINTLGRERTASWLWAVPSSAF